MTGSCDHGLELLTPGRLVFPPDDSTYDCRCATNVSVSDLASLFAAFIFLMTFFGAKLDVVVCLPIHVAMTYWRIGAMMAAKIMCLYPVLWLFIR